MSQFPVSPEWAESFYRRLDESKTGHDSPYALNELAQRSAMEGREKLRMPAVGGPLSGHWLNGVSRYVIVQKIDGQFRTEFFGFDDSWPKTSRLMELAGEGGKTLHGYYEADYILGEFFWIGRRLISERMERMVAMIMSA